MLIVLPLAIMLLASGIIPARRAWIVPISSTLGMLWVTIGIFYLGSKTNTVAAFASIPWMSVPGASFSLSIRLTPLTIVMMETIAVVSLAVHLYSAAYLADDPKLKRYYATLALFTFSMLGLVSSGNLLQLFFFWELVGFCSYQLIGHYRTRPSAGAAATKAFLMNRVGDSLLLSGLLLLYAQTGTLDLEQLTHLISADGTTWVALLIFGGVVAKSAQFPLFSWLPDAMEGPTPVSALIHAATMVAAGIFLLAQTHFIFSHAALLVVGVTGAITALLGAWGALIQTDIKKILAYSTLSQLGLMTMTLGAGETMPAMLHLYTHAFFKAGLFLGAGVVIHALHQPGHPDMQDIRQMSGLRTQLPLTSWLFMLCAASLAGLPLTSGLLSKDAMSASLEGTPWLLISFAVSALTAWYTTRLVWFVWWNDPNITSPGKPVPPAMSFPLLVMAAASLWFIAFPLPWRLESFIYPQEEIHAIGWLLPTAAVLNTAVVVAVILYYRSHRQVKESAIPSAFGIDLLIQAGVLFPVRQLAAWSQAIDRRIIDGVIHLTTYATVTTAFLTGAADRYIIDGLVNGAAKVARYAGWLTRSLSGGNIQRYLGWTLAALIIFLIWQNT